MNGPVEKCKKSFYGQRDKKCQSRQKSQKGQNGETFLISQSGGNYGSDRNGQNS